MRANKYNHVYKASKIYNAEIQAPPANLRSQKSKIPQYFYLIFLSNMFIKFVVSNKAKCNI